MNIPEEPKRPKIAKLNENQLTYQEAQQYWGYSVRTLKRLVKRGMPSIKVGHLRRILKNQSDSWLEKGGAKPVAPVKRTINNQGEV